MKITYLDHSGFSVSVGGALLVFDEYNPVPSPDGGGVVTAQDLEQHTVRALFLSHSHSDHWCREVTQLPFDGVYISEDFPTDAPGRRVKAGDVLHEHGLTIRAFGSTDLGVSFLVDAGGKRLFHAGDLNNWHWEDESTPQEIAEAERDFEAVLRRLAPYAGTVDIAFFPLDPRMGKNTARGILRFMQVMRPQLVIPMHTQGDAALAERFAAKHDGVRALTQRGAELEV